MRISFMAGFVIGSRGISSASGTPVPPNPFGGCKIKDDGIGAYVDCMPSSAGQHVVNTGFGPCKSRPITPKGGVKKKLICPGGRVLKAEFKNGRMLNPVSIRFSDESKYKGDYKNSKMNGLGTFEFSDGSKYTGRWREGAPATDENFNLMGQLSNSDGQTISNPDVDITNNGNQGKHMGFLKRPNFMYFGEMGIDATSSFYYPNGLGIKTILLSDAKVSTYDGEWKQGEMQGLGCNTFETGDRYCGEFDRNQRHGQGTQWGLNGGMYVGSWDKDSKKHGVQITVTKRRYSGDWKLDMRHGFGNETWAFDGRSYEGGWVKGQMLGTGCNIFPDGARYCGDIQNGSITGTGTMWGSDGSMYHGEWNDGIKNGAFLYTNSYGQRCTLDYVDGSLSKASHMKFERLQQQLGYM